MRRIVASIVAAALSSVFVVAPARAQRKLDLEVSPFGGGAFFLGDGPTRYALERSGAEPLTIEDARFDDTWIAGLALGLRFNDVLSVESSLAWMPTWLTNAKTQVGTDVYAYVYGITGVARLPVPGPVQPYWGVGVGAKTLDYPGAIRSHTQWMTTLLTGMSFDVGGGESIRVQARDLLARFDPSAAGARGGWDNDLLVTAGVSWRIPLGRHAPKRAPGGGFFPG